MKNTVFLEFYGLPGSGKSIISHLLANRYSEAGKTVAEPTYRLDHQCHALKRNCIKTRRTISYCFSHKNSFAALVKLMKETGSISFTEKISQIVNICSKLYCYEKYSFQYDYVIFDEGICQSIVSLSMRDQGNIEKSELDLFALLDQYNTIRIYIRTTIDVALERMNNRPENDSRIEKMNNTDLKAEMLKQMQMTCELLSCTFSVSGERPINEIVDSMMAVHQRLHRR